MYVSRPRHYRNIFHGILTIARVEGLLALQKALGPAIVYQFTMNGLRLGTYQTLVNAGLTRDEEGKTVFTRTVLAGALAGAGAGAVASPLYLVSQPAGLEIVRKRPLMTRLPPLSLPSRSRRSCSPSPRQTSPVSEAAATAAGRTSCKESADPSSGLCSQSATNTSIRGWLTPSGTSIARMALRACGGGSMGRCHDSW